MYVTGSIYLICAIPLVTKYLKTELINIIDCIENEFNFGKLKQQNIDFLWKKYDSVMTALRWLLFILSIEISVVLINFIYCIFFCDRTDLSKQNMYLMIAPYIEKVNSYVHYIIIYVLQVCWFLMMPMIGNCSVLFIIAVSCEYYNTYVTLCSHLHGTINNIVLKLQSEMYAAGTYQSRSNVESNFYQEFKKEFAVIVKQHRLITR